jgi:hypothetical protein
MRDIDQAAALSMKVLREFLEATYQTHPAHAKWLEDQVNEGGSISVLIDLLPFINYRVVLIKDEAMMELAVAKAPPQTERAH